VSDGSAKLRLFDWLDAIAKLVGAFAVVAVAVFANSLQTRVSGISIQSQREQAESQLRANMFTSLITPIVGTQTSGQSVPADRERLLAELLALNFYENFELKPLLQDASNRLLAEAEATRKLPADGSDVREPLWSVARRIAERQKASISWEWAAYRANQQKPRLPAVLLPWRASAQSSVQGCEVYFLTIEPTPRRPDIIRAGSNCDVSAAFRETVEMSSPDGNYSLRLVVSAPDWKNQTVKLSAQPFVTGQEIKPTDPTYSFTLTWFDLPLTDNTLLPDGNRFAAYLRTFYPDLETVRVAVMWFPNGYFTPRERPLNYTEVQELLGRKAQ
jgi:hypothetical protein